MGILQSTTTEPVAPPEPKPQKCMHCNEQLVDGDESGRCCGSACEESVLLKRKNAERDRITYRSVGKRRRKRRVRVAARLLNVAELAVSGEAVSFAVDGKFGEGTHPKKEQIAASLVGETVQVKWTEVNAWFDCEVLQYAQAGAQNAGEHLVCYSDLVTEWLLLKEFRVILHPDRVSE